MKNFFLVSLFFSFVLGENYKINESKVTYYGNHYLHKWEGSSGNIKGGVSFNKFNGKYQCSLNIPLNTFSSGNANRDSNMLIYCKAFDFPAIQFQSTSISLNQKSIDIEGSIDFAGIRRPLKTTAIINELSDEYFSIEGQFEISLSEFEIKRPSLMFVKIEDNMQIQYLIKGVINE